MQAATVDHANLALALALAAALILKELTSDADGRWRAVNRALPLGIIPLMLAFLATVGMKVAQYLHMF